MAYEKQTWHDGDLITAEGMNHMEDGIAAAGDMSNPMTTAGDIIIGGTSGAPTRLGVGTNGQVLTSNGTTASWQTSSGGGTTVVANPELTGNEPILEGLQVNNNTYRQPSPLSRTVMSLADFLGINADLSTLDSNYINSFDAHYRVRFDDNMASTMLDNFEAEHPNVFGRLPHFDTGDLLMFNIGCIVNQQQPDESHPGVMLKATCEDSGVFTYTFEYTFTPYALQFTSPYSNQNLASPTAAFVVMERIPAGDSDPDPDYQDGFFMTQRDLEAFWSVIETEYYAY
ncbi:MAG: hypothetical protein J6S67_23525 [Methanobrevibacter sp.]|nr:hypothetical protein [Methanobrevibacter sp.]